MMKESDLAYCGMICNKCPVFIAAATNDDALRQKTARDWTNRYAEILKTVGIESLKPEDINCHGCRSEHCHFFGCEKCAIKPCCLEKNLITCAGCQEYEFCDILKGFYSFDIHRPAKDRLDKIRRGR